MAVLAPAAAQERADGATGSASGEIPSWSQLFERLKTGIEEARPKVDSLEQRDGRAEQKGGMRLRNEFMNLYPLFKKLDGRLDEASAEERAELEELRALFEGAVKQIAQSQQFAAPEERRDDPFLATMLQAVQFYGSIRLRAFTDVDGMTEIDENTSRLGIRGHLELGKSWEFFGRGEWGVNVLTESARFFAGGDPGIRPGDENEAVPLRLALVGFDGPPGRISFGKQWAVYYDVGTCIPFT